jgi:hypothetical protein
MRRGQNIMATKGWAFVVFGATTSRPTIVCMREEALPGTPPPNWLVLGRESALLATDATPAPRAEPDSHTA